MRLVWLVVSVAWVPVMWAPGGAAATDDATEEKTRRKRQALGPGGCADMSLFNYLLYYYLIQAQNGHHKHTQADQMSAALLRLKQRRGTDPLPTLISTQAGQNALLAMLQNVAQNNPAQLLQLLTSIRDGGQQPLRQQPSWPAGFGGAAAAAGGYRQPAALTGFPPSAGAYPGLQASSALYRPQVQQALYPQQAPPATAAGPLRLPFGAGAGGGEDAKLDNSLQFSPSLRRQVYAPQPELEPTPTPPPARTVIREPSTRLHVSTVTLVTTVVTSRPSLVPLLFNGQQTSTEIMHTSTHVLTATQLRTLAVVVTPTVVEANGRTTTLYGGDGAPNAEIVTDLNYHDDEEHATTTEPTPTVPAGIFSTAVVSQAPPSTVYLQAPGPTALPPGTTVLQPLQSIIPTGQLVVQNGVTTVLAAAPLQQQTTPLQQPVTPPPLTANTTTTTKKPEGRLLALLHRRASARRRGLPLRGAAARRRQREEERRLAIEKRHEEEKQRDEEKRQRQEEKLKRLEQQQGQEVHQGQHVSTSVSVSVSGEPPVPVVQQVQAQPNVTTTPAPAPVFQPGQVPVYVEKDGVLVVAAGPLVSAGPIFTPETTTSPPTTPSTPAPVTAAAVVQAVTAAAAPPAVQTTPSAVVTPAAPVFVLQPQSSAAPTTASPPPTVSTAAPTTTTTTEAATAATSAPTTTTAKPASNFGFDFEETVYASPSTSSSSSSSSTSSSSSSSQTTEKVVTEEDFQNLLDGTFVILAKALPDSGSSTSTAKPPVPEEGSGAGPPSDSNVKVSVSYAVSTSVSEGR